MRVAVNAVAAYRGAAGIGRYAANVARSLANSWEDGGLFVLAREGSKLGRDVSDRGVTVLPCRPTGPM